MRYLIGALVAVFTAFPAIAQESEAPLSLEREFCPSNRFEAVGSADGETTWKTTADTNGSFLSTKVGDARAKISGRSLILCEDQKAGSKVLLYFRISESDYDIVCHGHFTRLAEVAYSCYPSNSKNLGRFQ